MQLVLSRVSRCTCTLLMSGVLLSGLACSESKSSTPTSPTPAATAPAPTPAPAPAPTPAPAPAPAPAPTPAPVAALDSVTVDPSVFIGGEQSTGRVTLTLPAPGGGFAVSLSSNDSDARVPSAISVSPGATAASFSVATSFVPSDRNITISASAGSTTRTASIRLVPSVVPTFSISSPRGGDCEIRNSSGDFNCDLDASGSTGTIGRYLWAYRVGSNEVLHDSGDALTRVVGGCGLAGGAQSQESTSGRFVSLVISLSVQDPSGKESAPRSRTVRLYTNGFCGYAS